MSTIAEVAIACLKRLKSLVLSNKLDKYESEVRQTQWKDELGRLHVWAANIGARRMGHLSLDHRLRDASHLKEQTIRVLKRLQRTLDDLQDAINEPAVPEDLSASVSDGEDVTEIQLAYNALRDTINNLFRMSRALKR
jgi:hypothetical protein